MARIIDMGANFLKLHSMAWAIHTDAGEDHRVVDAQDMLDIHNFFRDRPEALKMLNEYLSLGPALRRMEHTAMPIGSQGLSISIIKDPAMKAGEMKIMQGPVCIGQYNIVDAPVLQKCEYRLVKVERANGREFKTWSIGCRKHIDTYCMDKLPGMCELCGGIIDEKLETFYCSFCGYKGEWPYGTIQAYLKNTHCPSCKHPVNNEKSLRPECSLSDNGKHNWITMASDEVCSACGERRYL